MAKTKRRGQRDEISCEIVKIHGYLSKKEDKVLVDVSWNGGPTRTELRKCWETADGDIRLGAGMPLNDDEIKELIKLLKNRPKPVDFDEIFESSAGIMGIRNMGIKTEDGYPVLRVRKGGPFDTRSK